MGDTLPFTLLNKHDAWLKEFFDTAKGRSLKHKSIQEVTKWYQDREYLPPQRVRTLKDIIDVVFEDLRDLKNEINQVGYSDPSQVSEDRIGTSLDQASYLLSPEPQMFKGGSIESPNSFVFEGEGDFQRDPSFLDDSKPESNDFSEQDIQIETTEEGRVSIPGSVLSPTMAQELGYDDEEEKEST